MNHYYSKEIEQTLDQLIKQSRDILLATDSTYQNDKKDLLELERVYENMDLPRQHRMFINDYIACKDTVYERYAEISYFAGIRDTLALLNRLGLMKAYEQ